MEFLGDISRRVDDEEKATVRTSEKSRLVSSDHEHRKQNENTKKTEPVEMLGLRKRRRDIFELSGFDASSAVVLKGVL